jgi:acyl carrier protein
MELNDFLLKFKTQYIDADSITLESDSMFRNMDSYDSLTGMAILVMVKDESGIDIPDDVFKSLQTPREVFEFVQSKL